MALLNKLFTNRRKDSSQNINEKFFSQGSRNAPSFSKEQIRLLLFRECEGRSRKLMFDSSSIKKVDPSAVVVSNGLVNRLRSSGTIKQETEKTDESVQITQDGNIYQLLRPKADTKMLGEMVFGSVAMSFRGTTSKIHTIRTPPQLMISKVIPSPLPKSDTGGEKLTDSLSNSLAECIYVHESDHLERLSSSAGADLLTDTPPEWRVRSCHDYGEKNVDERQLRSTNSLNNLLENKPQSHQSSPTFSSTNLSHSGSYHSLQRRWLRYRATSMEFGFNITRNKQLIDETTSFSKRTKLGITLVVSTDEKHLEPFETFFFSHVTLIEGHLEKLRIAVEKAYVNKKNFYNLMFEGYENLRHFLYDLYTAPRLCNPVWLTMMSPHHQHHQICLRFLTELMSLITQYDVKSSKFFVSTLLTAVLTHHLAWVPTVMPPGINPSHSYHKKHLAKWVNALARSHPYNPLWVQLGDLYGAIGNPCKIARTVIIGKKSQLVERFLYVLSYFIRCSEVYENVENKLPEERRNFLSNSEPTLCTQQVEINKNESQDSFKILRSTSCDLCARSISPNNNQIQLRPGRHLCDPCRQLSRRAGDQVRAGRIFESPNDSSLTIPSVGSIDRDSGIVDSDDLPDSLSPSSSRVRFTIGDVPLKNIRHHHKRRKDDDCNCSLSRVSLTKSSGTGQFLALDKLPERDSGFEIEHVRNGSRCGPAQNLICSCNNKLNGRTRHKSEASSVALTPKEILLPPFQVTQAANSTEEYFRTFAWSLMANFTDHYMSDFALQGTNDTDFARRLCTDLCVTADKSVLDEPVAESVCILADIDNWSVQVISNKTCEMENGTYASCPVSMSQLVANATETLQHLWKLKMSPEFCLMHLEDRLQEIYFKSRLLAEYLTEKSTCDIEEMTNDLGLDASDLPLLMSVASTHSAPVTCMYGVSYR